MYDAWASTTRNEDKEMIELTEEEIADTKQKIEAIMKANMAEKIVEMDTPWEKCIVLSDKIIEGGWEVFSYADWDKITATIQCYAEDKGLGAYYAQIYPDKYKHLMDNYNKIKTRLEEMWKASYERRRKEEEENNRTWWRRIFG